MVVGAVSALVGRDASLADLGGALERASCGVPTIVLVSGETGVGKTSLVTEFVAGAGDGVLAGACVPVAGEPLPLAALTQALRTGAGHGVVRQELARSPELARLLPGAGSDDGSPAASPLRLFQAVLGLVGRMSAAGPVVLLVEDLQWADRATLDLLSFLGTNLRDERALLVLTYRDEAVGGGGALTSWLAEIGRLRATRRLHLGRLDREQTTELVRILVGSRPSPEQLATTLERSAGNPLFVEQLVLAGDRPGPLPDTLRELLRARIDTLPPGTRQLLRAAAVIGRVASVPLLARTLDSDDPAVEDQLRPALAAHVVEVRADDSIGFQHPAFREVAYAELLPGERARLHRSAAQALAHEPDALVAGEVARHWHRAGDLVRAYSASVAAGASYERHFAFADAHTSYALALELFGSAPAGSDRGHLLARAAETASLAGDAPEAVRLVGTALEENGSGPERAALLERLGSFHYLAGDGTAADRAFREALALIPPGEVSLLAARVHAALGLMAAAWSRYDDAEVACVEALRISRAVGARREEGRTLNAMALVAMGRGDISRGVSLVRESLALALAVEDAYDIGTAYVHLSHLLGLAGRLDEAVQLCHQGVTELERFGQGRLSGTLLLCNTSDALIRAGRLPEAEELIGQALERQPQGIMAGAVLLFSARLALARGDLATAWDHIEQARLVVESEDAPIGWLREVVETAAEVELWKGRPGAALELVTDGLHEIAGTDEELLSTGLVGLGLRALADDVALHRDARARAARCVQRTTLLAALPTAGVDEGVLEGAPLTALVDAELARLDGTRSPAPWSACAEAWTAIGRPLPALYARWREAEVLLAGGVGGQSTGVLRAAHVEAVSRGAGAVVDELVALARWYRVDLLPAAIPVPHPHDDGLAPYALTAREREVLAALAAGQTNKEIADALFISIKTASVHVSNILRKLDVPGRQEAARLAHRLDAGS